MELLNKLKSKRIKFIEIPKWGVYLRKQWEDSFANHLSDEVKREIHLHDFDGICGYLWHIFSYEKRQCLTGGEAEKAFNVIEKKACYIFYQHSDDVLLIEDASAIDSNDLLEESDVYVVDREFNWTYVQTHERGWLGPFFCEKYYIG